MQIISVTAYGGRLMALISVEGYIVPMYRSTGKAGVRGEWFPFAGILITEGKGVSTMIAPFHEMVDNHSGWIVKGALAIHKTPKGTVASLGWPKGGNHRNPEDRLTVEGFPVDLKRVSRFLKDTIGEQVKTTYFVEINEEGVNTWIREVSKEALE